MKKLVDRETGEIIEEHIAYQSRQTDGPFWKTQYNHDLDAETNNGGLVCNDKSKTQQQFAKDADINVILAKFLSTGEMTLTGTPTYGVVAEEKDLQDSIVTAYQVEEAWNALPAAARNALKDPKIFADYVDHCVQTGDLDPLREIGLAPPITAAEPLSPSGAGTPAAPKTEAPEPLQTPA